MLSDVRQLNLQNKRFLVKFIGYPCEQNVPGFSEMSKTPSTQINLPTKKAFV